MILDDISFGDLAKIDAACETLRKIAKATPGRIEVIVRADGRVEFRCENDSGSRWIVRSDLLPGGSDAAPSKALALHLSRRFDLDEVASK